ncbi:MAG: type II toxin-antitoxin system PemK/MazF family toxin [Deltaproteobacteria bacterium]|nr:type II toxin-antitoxin system PemK/MazF family toxin [Deltaproteobacteria bacterium]
MRRGEIYRSEHPEAERGGKPGYYAIVSRNFVASHDEIGTVVCAPVYSEILGIPTEVVIDELQGLRRRSAIRCDFLMLMFKRKLTRFVSTLPPAKLKELDRALAIALELEA